MTCTTWSRNVSNFHTSWHSHCCICTHEKTYRRVRRIPALRMFHFTYPLRHSFKSLMPCVRWERCWWTSNFLTVQQTTAGRMSLIVLLTQFGWQTGNIDRTERCWDDSVHRVFAPLHCSWITVGTRSDNKVTEWQKKMAPPSLQVKLLVTVVVSVN